MMNVKGALSGTALAWIAGLACASEPAAAAAPALPKAPIATLNTEQPVEIGADAASVRGNERVLVLTGNVVARQGEMELKADKATAYYAKSAAAPVGPGLAASIERLVAEGNVVVTRPGEVVKSASATYELSAHRIVMSGHVVATRNGNIVRGERVVVDLVNQTITLETGAAGGRVQGLFMPASTKKP
jgi:lipopolysaccharide export system protein LptA